MGLDGSWTQPHVLFVLVEFTRNDSSVGTADYHDSNYIMSKETLGVV
jgi:hypothetical protein